MIDPLYYITQQMQQRKRQIVFENFLFVPFEVGKLFYEIEAYNQHLFAEISKLPLGAVIVAENNAIEVKPKHKETSSWEEFSGQISIKLKEEQQGGGIEFIQIITSNGNT